MAQPGDLPGVGDDDVGVDDGRVVLGVSTGTGETETFISSRDISCFSSLRKKTSGNCDWKCGIFATFLSSDVRNQKCLRK